MDISKCQKCRCYLAYANYCMALQSSFNSSLKCPRVDLKILSKGPKTKIFICAACNKPFHRDDSEHIFFNFTSKTWTGLCERCAKAEELKLLKEHACSSYANDDGVCSLCGNVLPYSNFYIEEQ